MRIRILLAALLTAGLAALTPTAHAVSPTCRAAALSETGASDIVAGDIEYTGTATSAGLPPALADDDLSSGTLNGYLDLAAKACSNISYTVVAYDDTRATNGIGEPTLVEVARSTTIVRDGSRLLITFDVPEHPGQCLQLQATSSNGATTIDVAPSTEAGTADYVDACLGDGSGGNQYWN